MRDLDIVGAGYLPIMNIMHNTFCAHAKLRNMSIEDCCLIIWYNSYHNAHTIGA